MEILRVRNKERERQRERETERERQANSKSGSYCTEWQKSHNLRLVRSRYGVVSYFLSSRYLPSFVHVIFHMM